MSAIDPVLAFVGGGNMAASLISGWIAAGHKPSSLRVAEPDAARRAWLVDQFGVAVFADNAQAVSSADAVLLAVKPQQMQAALAGLVPPAGCLVLSIAAGLRLATLRAALGESVALVRSMPNTPALLGHGISGLFAAPGTGSEACALAQAILSAGGRTVWLESEDQLDAVTALSGSGPAYFFLLTEAGVRLGLAPATAAALARQTFIGSARMAEGESVDVTRLRAQVTSRGGTTEAAVSHLESAGLRRIFAEALAAATERSRQLSQALVPPAPVSTPQNA